MSDTTEKTPIVSNLDARDSPADDDDDDDGDDRLGNCSGGTTRLSKHVGIIYGLGAGAFAALTGAFAKLLIETQSTGQILLVRYSVHLLVNILFVRIVVETGMVLPRGEIVYVVLKTTMQCLAIATLYLSFLYLQYVDSLVISSGFFVLLTAAFARMWLKENVSGYKMASMLIILVGVVVTSQPTLIFDFHDVRLERGHGFRIAVGIIFSIASAGFHAVASCVSRRIQKTEAIVVTAYLSMVGVVVGAIFLTFVRKFAVPDNATEISLTLSIGVSSFVAHLCLTRGLQTSVAAEVVISTQIEIPAGILFQFFMLCTPVPVLSIVGSVCVVAGVILIAVEKYFWEKRNI